MERIKAPSRTRMLVAIAAGICAIAVATTALVAQQTADAHHGICDRTQEVQDAILDLLATTSNCADVTDEQLAAITGTLDLSGQEIDELDHRDLNGLTNVRVVDLSDNDLDLIPLDLFNETTSLEEMLINDNDLTRLPTNPWVTNTSLVKIDASNNAIDELHADPFPYPNLREVDLSDNSIDRLAGYEFAVATAIEDINLENNWLHGVASSWHDSASLRSIKLAGNPGAPFSIPVSLSDLGGGVFEVNVELGAPLPIRVGLSASGGNLSEDIVTVPNGAHHSQVIEATPDGNGPISVSIDSVAFARGTQTGMVIRTGQSVSLDASSAPQGICGRTKQIQYAISAHLGQHCSGIDIGQLSQIEDHFAVVDAGIESFKAGDLAGLTSVDDLYLYGNNVAELPAGFFEGAGNFKRVLLQDNPGADFPLHVSIVQKDDGSMVVSVREGTPFIIRAALEAEGGTLSERVRYVYGGDTESRAFSVTPDQPGGHVNVSITEAKFQDEWQLLKHSYYDGFHLNAAGHVMDDQNVPAADTTPAPQPTLAPTAIPEPTQAPTPTATPEPTQPPLPASPPPHPNNLTGRANGDGAITLSWEAPADESVTGYRILRRRPLEGEDTLLVYVADTGNTATTYTDTAVTAGTRHVYRVKAINRAGVSLRSNFVRVDP